MSYPQLRHCDGQLCGASACGASRPPQALVGRLRRYDCACSFSSVAAASSRAYECRASTSINNHRTTIVSIFESDFYL